MIAFMKEITNALLDAVYMVMPVSPFSRYIDSLASLPYLGYLNWFIPVKNFLAIGGAWLVSIFLWYFYGIILRWLKAIE
ncbi:hypothetical protein [Kineothrix alysoides]|uniref:hypothetical protein n=1 Tax=Kineothrix alysoides TaxID=1469948 RepID=UPI0004DB6CA2|nr:hypothetical protein [Kineothrix alysoides]